MHGKPGYLPLERLRSAGADKERVLAIGAIPILLYHGSDFRATVGHAYITCLNGPCYRLSCMAWQSPDMQDRVVLDSHQG